MAQLISPKKSIEICFVTPGSRGFSVFAHMQDRDNEILATDKVIDKIKKKCQRVKKKKIKKNIQL